MLFALDLTPSGGVGSTTSPLQTCASHGAEQRARTRRFGQPTADMHRLGMNLEVTRLNSVNLSVKIDRSLVTRCSGIISVFCGMFEAAQYKRVCTAYTLLLMLSFYSAYASSIIQQIQKPFSTQAVFNEFKTTAPRRKSPPCAACSR